MTDLTEGLLPGLLASHVKTLRRKRIRTLDELAAADRKAVHGAFAGERPRPTYAVVDAWIAAARQPEETPGGTGPDEGWESLAGFVLSFERHTDGTRRLVAEQAERPAPQPRQEWSGWPVQEAARWVADTVTAELPPAVAAPEEPAPGPRPEPDPAPEEASTTDPTPQDLPEPDVTPLVLEELAVVGRAGRTDLRAPATTQVGIVAGDRLVVRGVPVMPFEAVLMVSRPGHRSARLGPARADAEGRLEIVLEGLPPGVHSCRLVAYPADDDGRPEGVPALAPAVVRLPPLALTR